MSSPHSDSDCTRRSWRRSLPRVKIHVHGRSVTSGLSADGQPGSTVRVPPHRRPKHSRPTGEFLAQLHGMHRRQGLTLALVICALVGGVTICRSKAVRLSPEARLVAIRRAQVWKPTSIPAMDLVAGPQGRGALAPGATVTCEFRPKTVNGRSPKFTCVLADGDEVKVKYGKTNGEVYGEVAATRLLWSLGFLADR